MSACRTWSLRAGQRHFAIVWVQEQVVPSGGWPLRPSGQVLASSQFLAGCRSSEPPLRLRAASFVAMLTRGYAGYTGYSARGCRLTLRVLGLFRLCVCVLTRARRNESEGPKCPTGWGERGACSCRVGGRASFVVMWSVVVRESEHSARPLSTTVTVPTTAAPQASADMLHGVPRCWSCLVAAQLCGRSCMTTRLTP